MSQHPPCRSGSREDEGVNQLPAPARLPQRADAQRNREKIIVAAQRVLASDGLAAQMVDIARAAGVGTGTLYRHFRTRDEIVDAVLERMHLDLAAAARAALGSGDPGAVFTVFIEQLADALSTNLALADDAAARGVTGWQDYNQELADAIGELLVAAQQSGAVRNDVVTMDVIALVVGVTRGRRAEPGAWRRGLAIVMDGLRATPRTALP